MVFFESTLLKTRGPRRMSVVLPALDDVDRSIQFRPLNDKEGILNAIK